MNILIRDESEKLIIRGEIILRVITGLARGRKLKEPAGDNIRPTTDMVKEAIFNIIQFSVEGRRVLDLFAGTGQLGLEALSRGAREVVFVDQAQTAINLVEENLASTKLEGGITVRSAADSYLRSGGKFDLIFLDPPYDSGYLDKMLKIVQQIDILNENGIIVAESTVEKSLPEMEHPYEKLREYGYGKVKITVYTRHVCQ